MEFNRVKDLLDGLGVDGQGIAEVDRLGEFTWLIGFDDGVAVAAEWMDSPPRLALSTPVGRPHVDRRFNVYETLLSFNALWRENGGARVSLDGDDGNVVITFEAADPEITAGRMQDLLTNWREMTNTWRSFVTAPPEAITLPAPNLMMFDLRA